MNVDSNVSLGVALNDTSSRYPARIGYEAIVLVVLTKNLPQNERENDHSISKLNLVFLFL